MVQVRAVVFDLDGTLVEFNIEYRELRAEVKSFLITKGVPASLLSHNDSIFGMLSKTEIFMRNNGSSYQQIACIKQDVFRIAEKYEQEAAKTLSLRPGAMEVLRTLRERGLKIGLCTLNGEKTVNYVLEKFRIKKFFDVAVSRDRVEYVKPHHGHLDAALKALGVKPEEAIMVGDSPMDMRSARELNVIAVGLPTSLYSEGDLIEAGANYIVTSITDIPILIKQLLHS